jgi:hypothetical protein
MPVVAGLPVAGCRFLVRSIHHRGAENTEKNREKVLCVLGVSVVNASDRRFMQ